MAMATLQRVRHEGQRYTCPHRSGRRRPRSQIPGAWAAQAIYIVAMRRQQPWLVVVLVGALVGLVFAGVSTYDFVQHLDRQVHSLHCSFIPGVSHGTGESGCQVAMMSPYSSVFRTARVGRRSDLAGRDVGVRVPRVLRARPAGHAPQGRSARDRLPRARDGAAGADVAGDARRSR